MDKYLFLCGVHHEQERNFYALCVKNCTLENAANTFQWNLIDGFIKNNVDFDVISAPFLPCYPFRFRRRNIDQISQRLTETSIFTSIAYSCMFYNKELSIYKNLVQEVANWCTNNIDYRITIIIYSTNAVMMQVAKKIKQHFKDIHICLIVTDLIDDAANFSLNRTVLKRIKISIEKRIVYSGYESVDCFVLLTEYMKEHIQTIKDNYCIVEGIYSPHDNEANYTNDQKKENFIFYSGSLDEYTNVDSLVRAFLMITHKNCKLIICGDGYYANYIRYAIAKNKNIQYLGNIAREQVLKLQRSATLLVNPRKPSPITKYSFPSKTIEYFVSGTPTIMYRLDGIPAEYYNYCFTVNGLTDENLASTIDMALDSKERLKQTGLNAMQFIKEGKNSQIQVAKIISLITENNKK